MMDSTPYDDSSAAVSLTINRVVKSSWLLAKIATYLVSIGWLLCLAFLYGWPFFKLNYPWTGRLL